MLFSSALFVFAFLPLVLGVYFALHPRLRNLWLLATSLVFYAWGEPAITLVMLASILGNYLLGLAVEPARARGLDGLVVAGAVAFDLGLLFLFKYADWLWELGGSTLVALGLLDAPWPALGEHLAPGSPWRALLLDEGGGIRLPVGISFFTFQALSYVIDVRRREASPQRNPLDLALYVTLFPQLVAGPIVRYRDVAVALVQRSVTRAGFAEGIRRFVLGLGKKVLIANLCAEAADGILGTGAQPGVPGGELTTALAWLAMVAYTLQIYFDFSGYSDMAIGLGRMFGFRFLENFAHPYVARSITEFWRRWHISLSTWFRDYLYIPLGGNRRGKLRTCLNLLVVFALCGLWHGASASFLLWGLYHGAFLALERLGLGARLERLPRALRHAYTLLVVLGGWVLFRCESLAAAREVYAALLGLRDGGRLLEVAGLQVAAEVLHPLGRHADVLTWLALAAGLVGSIPWLPWLSARLARWRDEGRALRCTLLELGGLAALALVFVHVAMALASGSYNPFIYFRF